MVWFGVDWCGLASLDLASLDLAWFGVVWRGVARFDLTGTRNQWDMTTNFKPQSVSSSCSLVVDCTETHRNIQFYRQFEKVVLKYGWTKVPKWECLFVNREKRLLLSVYEDDIELAGKKQNINPTWKILMKEVELEGHAKKCVEPGASSRRDNHAMTDRRARKGQTGKYVFRSHASEFSR